MHRVELKVAVCVRACVRYLLLLVLFLMYRVELKVWFSLGILTIGAPVPNVPCGVEREKQGTGSYFPVFEVPNVPCGVERKIGGLNIRFLPFAGS